MLSLTRKKGQSVDIFVDGRVIEVKVVKVFGLNNSQVRLAFSADKDIKILRREVIDKDKAL